MNLCELMTKNTSYLCTLDQKRFSDAKYIRIFNAFCLKLKE